MRLAVRAPGSQSPPAVPPDRLRTVLRLLLRASDAARRAGCPRADLALRGDALLAQGADEATLRLLLATGHVGCAPRGRRGRPGRGAAPPRVRPASRLLLTEQGVVFARSLLGEAADDGAESRPSWRAALGELWRSGACVKQLRHEAANQRGVLAAFEEAGWPSRLADPLPPEPGVNPKTRLRETVRSLNRGQRCIRFRMDGTGLALRWQAIP